MFCPYCLFYDILLIDSILFSHAEISICNGDSLLIEGLYQHASGTYYDTLMSQAGCDSIVEIQLIVIPPLNISSVNYTICNGDSVFLAGQYQNNAGIYYDTLSSIMVVIVLLKQI